MFYFSLSWGFVSSSRGIARANGERENPVEKDREHIKQASDFLEAKERAAEEGLRVIGSV